MNNLPENNKPKDIQPEDKVTGSLLYRNLPPEDIKKIKAIAKKIAKENGLIINIIVK